VTEGVFSSSVNIMSIIKGKLYHLNSRNTIEVLTVFSNQKKRLPPDQKATDHILHWGTEHPGITSTNPQIDLETYALTIEGEVDNPVKLGWKDFLALPQTVSVSDFHCVEGERFGLQMRRRHSH
jgi:DMSO/TMAO reductase YedYZ molybdopterin-dependent catalytic subunit